MSRINVSEARKDFAELLDRAYGGERIVLVRRGKNVAAIVSIEGLEMLEAMEDRLDVEEARKRLRAAKRTGTIPYEKVRKGLGLA